MSKRFWDYGVCCIYTSPTLLKKYHHKLPHLVCHKPANRQSHISVIEAMMEAIDLLEMICGLTMQ